MQFNNMLDDAPHENNDVSSDKQSIAIGSTHMISLLDETVISLVQAAREVPSLRMGKRTNPATIWRWAHHGVRRNGDTIRLETFCYGGKTATTREAVQRFLARCAGGHVEPAVAMPSRSRQHLEASGILDAAGI